MSPPGSFAIALRPGDCIPRHPLLRSYAICYHANDTCLRCLKATREAMKILVIEDELNIARVIQLYLEQANYMVLVARDGVAGLELHAREHPDLIILDLMLPALDGMEVCRRIRAWANTPILMLTARQGEEDRIAGLDLGADDYLVKPFSPREVVSRVKAILRRTAPIGDQHTEQIDAPMEAVGVRNGEYASAYSSHNGNQATAYGVAGKNTGNSAEEIRFDALRISIPERRVEVHGQEIG